jgi:hypothetical protein
MAASIILVVIEHVASVEAMHSSTCSADGSAGATVKVGQPLQVIRSVPVICIQEGHSIIALIEGADASEHTRPVPAVPVGVRQHKALRAPAFDYRIRKAIGD